MSLYKGTRRVKKIVRNGISARMLVHGGRQIWPCRGADPLPQMDYRIVLDADGYWFEVGFRSPEELTGSAATGWTDPRGYARLDLLASQDLQTWDEGLFEDCATTAIDNGDGTWDYWSRTLLPSYWISVLVDETATTNRYGKSITGISLQGVAVTAGMSYPYAMPADAATLQTDLRAAGYTGATVTTTSAALTAAARDHTPAGAKTIYLTQSGGSVTAATPNGGSPITSGMAYPYSMPSQRAALQADLRTAGLSGAVVMLYDDPWTVILPDILATGLNREFTLTITPGDPYKTWDIFGNYTGEAPANAVNGVSGNVRTPGGSPLLELDKQFARMRITRGARVLP